MTRGYQYDYSKVSAAMYDVSMRERKARTMIAVLRDYIESPLDEVALLNVGGSTGIIDNYLSQYFDSVIGIDIDEIAIRYANKTFRKKNLKFQVADALALPFMDNTFEVIICSQVYEHVPDSGKMFDEIFRVLKPTGVCFFSASNRLMYMEPHYHLPFLSVLPRILAHRYMRLAGKGNCYHEQHLSYWGLKRLVRKFLVIDYTLKIVLQAKRFYTDYMIQPNSLKGRMAVIVLKYFHWASPRYIWLLKKPENN